MVDPDTREGEHGPLWMSWFPMRVLEEESFPYASCNCLVGDTDDDAVELFDAMD